MQSSAWILLPSAPFHDTIIFARDGDGYGYKGMSHDRDSARLYSGTVGADAVMRLIAALRAPLQPSFRFDSLGVVGPEALGKIQDSIRKDMRDRNTTRRQKVLLAVAMDDPRRIEAAISGSSPMTHTDDYPAVNITAELEDCTSVEAKSVSQHWYMLPWTIKDRGKTFTPAIAQALYDLLPPGFGARGRLDPERASGLRSLVEMFRGGMDARMEEARAEDLAGVPLAGLEEAFSTSGAAVRWTLRDDESDVVRRQDLLATLRLPETPANLEMRFRVSVTDGKAPGLDTEIQRAKALLQRVAGNPVLAVEMAVNANDRFTIDYWYGTSLHRGLSPSGDDNMGEFAGYMTKMKGITLTQRQLDDAALATEDGTPMRQWIVLADGRTVLWHDGWQGNWEARAKSCGVDPDSMPMFGCAGRMFAPDGKPVP